MKARPEVMRGHKHMVPSVRAVPVRVLGREKLHCGVQLFPRPGQVGEPVFGIEVAGGVNGDEEEVGLGGLEGADGALQQSPVNGDLRNGLK